MLRINRLQRHDLTGAGGSDAAGTLGTSAGVCRGPPFTTDIATRSRSSVSRV